MIHPESFMKKGINCRKVMELYKAGMSQQKIAEQEHMSKTSVSSVIKAVRSSALTEEQLLEMPDEDIYFWLFPNKKRADLVGAKPDFETVHESLLYPGHTLKSEWEEYREICQENGRIYIKYAEFCKEYADYTGTSGLPNHTRHRLEGVCMTCCDTFKPINVYTHTVRRAYLFLGMLIYSPTIYTEAVYENDPDMILRCMKRMFSAFGGVPRRVLMRDTKDVDRNFFEFYHAQLIQEKNSALASVSGQIVDMVNAHRCRSITECNAVLRRIMIKQNNRNLKAVIYERKKLYPLPGTDYSILSIKEGVTGGQNCHIRFEGNYYSFPYQYRGILLSVLYDEKELRILAKRKIVATHQMLPPDVRNQFVTIAEHLPPDGQKAKLDKKRLISWAESIGKNTMQVVVDVFNSVTYEEQGYVTATAILGLADKYSRRMLEEGCRKALINSRHPRYRLIKECINEK